ncbi:alpha/beta fold hydrolase [Paracoccus denitrificans]|jgi:pimeloyl-ACP methyl ester carboxylesterase|uniref:AB hydrolase-1 domain-containing protein n=1 Tax=Paracoccus denitrificans (strain Pd 1222) TaxID=318586 RepID=A1B4Q3_PARDP|nr:alpha/beta fold hydrolase [Paracoccus denitrificans]ABL70497.1 hypothetical protein Pden_2409 [Paracoccus denitrificans PD1222]MBB4629694.1 pimeloyl-ACP methyl ester carboxylesterase [Paracoccus denitrificans]MCU7431110.1 prolyl oligopeptidase family serine peptidase [Paracoccus denitrificans]QAR25837.1 alpha/beta hydrolase [Paracoccus denitrificans]UFS65718.1 prolyl oligopeptidase family serine peptidase [Paracoccus denitrificans]
MWRIALVLALALTAASHALAEVALPWGVEIPREDCELSAGGVWSEYDGGADCLRYFASPGIDAAAVVIVVLRGDRDTWVGRKPEDIPRNTSSAQTALAGVLAEEMGFPVIILSRPGTFGSSGDHLRRRQPEEFLALAGALDDIRADHRIGRFVLMGHSGGATAAAALLTLGRDDIACAVLTSGAFDLLERAEALREARGSRSRPGLDLTGLPHPYDPMEHLDGIVDDPQRLIVVIGNRDDRVTPFHFQRRFHEGLVARGHRAELREAAAQPPGFHDLLGNPGARAAAECAAGGTP